MNEKEIVKRRLLRFFTFVAVLVVLNSCSQDLDRNLVAHYSFDGQANDISGHDNHGTVNGATVVNDRFGEEKAYSFDGLNDAIIIQSDRFPAIEAPKSVSWWFKVDSLPQFRDEWGAGNIFALVDSGSGIGVQAGFRGPAYQSRGLDVWMWGGETLLEVDPPVLKEWHFCVYSFDGQTHRFYLNGKEEAASTVPAQSGQPTLLMFGNYPGGEQYYQGCLDDVRIYNRALAPSVVKKLFLLHN